LGGGSEGGQFGGFSPFSCHMAIGKYADDATWRLAELDGGPAAYGNYLKGFPGGKYAGLAEQKLLKAVVDSALSQFAPYVVNTCFIGGQNIYSDYGNIVYDRGSNTLRTNLTIHWNGLWYADNRYHVTGDFSLSADGSNKTFVMKGGLSWDGTRCVNPITMS
jgi:hypothetical protein